MTMSMRALWILLATWTSTMIGDVEGFMISPTAPPRFTSTAPPPAATTSISTTNTAGVSVVRPSSRLFLKDWVADMIDKELYRQQHHKEYEVAWMEKNRPFILQRLNGDDDDNAAQLVNTPDSDHPEMLFREYQRDRVMAMNDPKRYCADRCITTGNCDVLEDFYDLSAKQVIDFCEECVLDESEESACQLPDPLSLTKGGRTTMMQNPNQGRGTLKP